MEEPIKALLIMKEFVAWYESREEMPTDKLHEFYVKFKYLVDQEPPEKPLILEKS